MKKNDFLLIGKIVGIHGIKGNIKVYSYAESLSFFDSGKQIFLKNIEKTEKPYTIEWAKLHKRVILLSLKGVDSRKLAESLVGSELYIEMADLPALEEGNWYWFDIIGLEVFTTDDQYLGRIKSIIPTGSNDVYVVKDKEKEIQIPALESVVIKIDLTKKRMKVDLPEGL